jgi:MFS family permease
MSTSSQMRIVFLFCLAHFCHHLCTATLAPLLPLIRDGLKLNYFQAGLLVSSFAIFYGFGQIPAAILADRLDRAKILMIGLIGTSISSVGVTLSWEYWQMLLCFSFMGLMGATYHALAASLISDRVPTSLRGRALGTHIIGGSSGFLVTPFLAVGLAHWAGNWRWPFIFLGTPALICAIILWLGPFRKSQSSGAVMEALRPNQQRDPVGRQQKVSGSAEILPHFSYLEIIRKIGLLAGLSTVIHIVHSSVSSYFPLYLVDHLGISSKAAGLTVGLISGGGIIGAPTGGILSDRIGRKAVILLSLGLSGPLLMGITWAGTIFIVVVLLLIYGMVTIARSPAMESLIVDVTPSHRRATVLSFYYLASQETSGILTPVVGYMIDHQGATFAFTTLAGALTLAGTLAWVYRKKI